MRIVNNSIILLVIITIIAGITPVIADNSDVVRNNQYDLLCALGFFKESSGISYFPEAVITRGEFISTVMRPIPKFQEYNYSSVTSFSNVDKNESYAKAAEFAKIMGYIDGSMFYGDEPITVEDAARIFLYILGYKELCEIKGVEAATAEVGFMRNIALKDKLSFNVFVYMIFDALNTNVLIRDITGVNNRYNVYRDRTFLTEILKIKKFVGIVNATSDTKLYQSHKINKDMVMIDGIMYFSGESGAAHFLGQRVEYYYRYNELDEYYTLVYLKGTSNNTVTDCKADNLTYKDGQYLYSVGNRSTKYVVSRAADIIYNGRAVSPPFNKFVPDDGNVRLIDNNGDGIVDVVIIDDYETIIVKRFDYLTYIISDMYDKNKDIALNDVDRYYIQNVDGNPESLTTLRRWSILSVAISLDKKIVKIIVSNRLSSGSVTGKYDNFIFVDGIEHEISGSINVEIGEYGNFYFDRLGKIAAFDRDGFSGQQAGYLLDVVVEQSISKKLNLKIFGEDNRFAVYKASSKIKIDEDIYSNPVEAFNAITHNRTDIQQLILFKLNANKEIFEIDLALAYTNDLRAEGFRQFTKPETPYTFRVTHFENAFRINQNTKLFIIPEDSNYEDQFAFYENVGDYMKSNTQYLITSYSISGNMPFVDYVIAHLKSSASNLSDYEIQPMLVSKVTQMINNNDEETRCLYGLHEGKEVRYILKTTQSLMNMNFHAGDVIKIRRDATGVVSAATKLMDGNTMSIATGSNPSTIWPLYENRYYFASVYSNNDGVLFVTTKNISEVKNVEDGEYTFANIYPYIYKYNAAEKRVYKETIDGIKDYLSSPNDYSKVFSYFRYSDPYLLVIYE